MCSSFIKLQLPISVLCPLQPLSPNTSFDPTEYVQKQRVTKTTPPKPAVNPLQFIQIKPCNLYQSAQDQLRKAEEVKKTKVTKKEDAEDWQGVSVTLLSSL